MAAYGQIDLKTTRFKATDFFRMEQYARSWRVTAEEKAFLSWGTNHLHPDQLRQDDNRDGWRTKPELQACQQVATGNNAWLEGFARGRP